MKTVFREAIKRIDLVMDEDETTFAQYFLTLFQKTDIYSDFVAVRLSYKTVHVYVTIKALNDAIKWLQTYGVITGVHDSMAYVLPHFEIDFDPFEYTDAIVTDKEIY